MAEVLVNTNNEMVEGFVNSLYYQIMLTEKYAKVFSKQLEEKYNLPITLDELTALSIVSQHNGEIHQRKLAQIILKDRANTGRMLKHLEQQELISREEQTKNKRQVFVLTVTDKGVEMINSLNKVIKPVFNRISTRFPKDKVESIKTGLMGIRKVMKEILEIDI